MKLNQRNFTLAVAVGLILVCVSIALLTWAAQKDAAEQSNEPHGEIPSPIESQTEPSSEQETDLASEPVTKPQAEPTEEPEPTGEPALTAEYELIYEGINVFDFATHYAYFKYKDVYADLYMRRLQDDTGEYIELSLWSDQKKIWNTVNRDLIEDDLLFMFWQEKSQHLTLDQRLCYYVVPLDGTVYLMRYCVETASDCVTMSYKVFGIDCIIDSPYYFLGNEATFDADSVSLYLVSDSAVDLDVSFPIEQMTAFADTVKGYMENGYLAASTLHGVFEVGTSADRDNPVSPYLYDIFPWIPQLVTQHSVNTEDIHSPKQMLTALQKALPSDVSVAMPDVAADRKYFITGDYHSGESHLTVHRKEDGSYEGTILIHNLMHTDFTGYYDNGILSATEISDYPDIPPHEMEISFKNGEATVTITAAYEEGFVKVGDTFILDRNEKPEEFLRFLYLGLQ